MLKSEVIVIYAIFCTSLLTAKFVLNNTNITREWSMRTYNPAVLKLNNQLLTVTKSNVSINLTSTDPFFKPCQISINPETDHLTSKIRARALGNGKIVIWGVESLLDDKNDLRIVKYVVFVIDPQSCSAKRLMSITDEVPNSWLQYWGSLVIYQDSFDVFFRTQQTCSPCRFSDKGEKIELAFYLGENRDNYGNYIFYSIDTVQENDPMEGYIYVYQFTNKTAHIRVLNEKFEVKVNWAEFVVNSFEAYSVTKGYVSICASLGKDWFLPGTDPCYTYFCKVWDTNRFNDLVAWGFMFMSASGRPADSTIRVIENDSAWIAVAHVHPEPEPALIYVQKLEPTPGASVIIDDELSEPVEFQRIERNYPFEMQGFVLEGEYCLVTVERKVIEDDYDKTEVNLTVKCMTAND